MLLFVASHKGSSPGKQGFKMMVSEDGFLYGSIGGGITEFNMVEKAKALLANNKQQAQLFKQVHRSNEPDSSGMICAGEQLIIIYPMCPDFIPTLEKFITANKGVLSITPNRFDFIASATQKNTIEFYKNHDENWDYKELINGGPHLYIIGGGHVGLATSKLFKSLNFRVTLLDCRQDLNTFVENTYADKKRIIDYNEITNYIPEGKHTYIVVMTHKYDDDRLIISKLSLNKYRYLGLLGSRSKIKILFRKLITEGFKERELKKIDAPIGLPINSKTPEEIAVSIAAKIIAVKNE